jgi:membrane-associated phospholipid phosphatase
MAVRPDLSAFAAGCALSAAGVYAVAFDTARGRSADARSLGLPGRGAAAPTVGAAAERAVETIDVASILLLGSGIVALALLRRRPSVALAAAVLVAGANVTTQVLKPLLRDADPLGSEALRAYHGTFPSGHATVAMSLALAAVLAAPAALRTAAALVGGAWAAAIGISLLVTRAHYGSDIAAGYLVAGAWAGLVAAVVPTTATRAGAVEVRRGAALGGLVVAAFAVAVAATLVRHPALVADAQLHRRFAAASGVLVVLAFAVPAAFAALLQRRRRGTL